VPNHTEEFLTLLVELGGGYSAEQAENLRPAEWRTSKEEAPSLPLPPPGKLQQNYPG
jgi:hypothetical protein